MPSFKYIAKDSMGNRKDGTIEAKDRNAALLSVRQKDLTPLSITQTNNETNKLNGINFKSLRNQKDRMSSRAMLSFSRELADLLSSGMNLGRALHLMAEHNHNNNNIVKRLRDEVVQGSSLSDALKIFPTTFPQLYVSMVRAGEASGSLEETLHSLRHHYERVQASRSKVISAMVYPMIVLAVGILSVIGLMVFIIPRFSSILDELGGTMPLSTKILMSISNVLIQHGWLIILVLAIVTILLTRFFKTEAGIEWKDKQMLKAPVVSKIAKANCFANFAKTLETLIHNGVPILRALSISEDVVGNTIIAKEIQNARAKVTDGSNIAGPLASGKVFPELFTDMLAVGEETGDLPKALGQISKRYDEELDFSIKLLTTVLEPVLILGVALIIGFVAISMLVAVFDLTSGLGTV